MCLFFRERRRPFTPRHLRGTQRTDVLALVTRFCVQLRLERGATEPSSPNTVKKQDSQPMFDLAILMCTVVSAHSCVDALEGFLLEEDESSGQHLMTAVLLVMAARRRCRF